MDGNEDGTIGRLRGNLGDLASQLQRLIELLGDAPEVGPDQLRNLDRLRQAALRLEQVLDVVERAGTGAAPRAGDAAAEPPPGRMERRSGAERRGASPHSNSFLRHLAGTPLDRRRVKDRRGRAESAPEDWQPITAVTGGAVSAENLIDFAAAKAERRADSSDRKHRRKTPSAAKPGPERNAFAVVVSHDPCDNGCGTGQGDGDAAGGSGHGRQRPRPAEPALQDRPKDGDDGP